MNDLPRPGAEPYLDLGIDLDELVREAGQARRDLELALRHAARAHPDPVLREMAREITEGRATIEQALRCDDYAEAIARQWDPAFERWQAMSEAEREQALSDAEEVERRWRQALTDDR